MAAWLGEGSSGCSSDSATSSISSMNGRDDDLILNAEVATAREWYLQLRLIGDAENDHRCPGGGGADVAGSGGNGAAKGGRVATDWTEGGCPQRSTSVPNSCPRDMVERYVGACNIQTVIKEASFFGNGGGYIAAGSDDGRVFIWERASGKLTRAFKADDQNVNCVVPHPSLPILATSGLEDVVRLWSPLGKDEVAMGEERQGEGDDDPRSLEQLARSNQGSIGAGRFFCFRLSHGMAWSASGWMPSVSNGLAQHRTLYLVRWSRGPDKPKLERYVT
ncbi:unnamed protein product [Laminaria digitata]